MKTQEKRRELARDWVPSKPGADKLASGIARVATLYGKGHRVKVVPVPPPGWGYYVLVTAPAEDVSEGSLDLGQPPC